jgi:hypothetical protein
MGIILEAIMTEKARQDLPQTPQTEQTGCLPAIVRLIWFAFGNLLLITLAILIVKRRTFSIFDIIFWVTVILLVMTRYFDIARLQGLTVENEPATLQHWKHYTLMLFLISVVLWSIAHAIRFITSL